MKSVFKQGSAVSLTAVAWLLAGMLPALAEDNVKIEETIIVVSDALAAEAKAQAARTPGGADVVTHEDYADRFLVSVRDTLAFSPGVYTQPRYGQEVRISIRGSGISRGYHMRGLTLLQDGVRINTADDNGDFQELEPIFFDHLEVYRGANALRFGSGTLGGAINGVTPTGKTAEGGYIRADLGSWNTARGLVSYGWAGDRLDGWGAVSMDTSDGDRANQERSSIRFQGNLGYDVTDRISTRFYVSYNEIDQRFPGALTREAALSDPGSDPSVIYQGRDVDSLRIQNQTQIDLGASRLSLGAFYSDKELYHPIFQILSYNYDDMGVFGRWDWASDRIEVTLGVDARTGETDGRRFINNNGSAGPLSWQADMDAWTSSAYGEVRYQASEQLTLIAGAIYAAGEREQYETFNMFAGGPTGVKGHAEFDAFSPKFGLLYDVNPDIQFYANYSASAEFPSFLELGQVAAFVPVDKQTAWTMEAGTRGQAGIAQWDVSVYRSEIDGEILQYTVRPDVPASTFNADQTIHQGLEAGLGLQFTDWLRLNQIYTWSDFRFEGDTEFGDNALPVVPEHVYRAELQFTHDRFSLAPNLEWVPEGAWADYRNTMRGNSYTLLGLTGSYKATERVDLFLDARNLTDEKATGDISAVILAGPASEIFYPVERRAVFGGIRARF